MVEGTLPPELRYLPGTELRTARDIFLALHCFHDFSQKVWPEKQRGSRVSLRC